MKVGDYVRTKDGIGRTISFSYQEDDECCFIELSNRRTGIKQFNIIKSSPNIIDLIEVGDYVNNAQVVGKIENKIIINLLLPFELEEKDIKSIVTKEQFKNMEYKL